MFMTKLLFSFICLLIGSTTLVYCANEYFYFSENPKSQNVAENSTVELRCNVSDPSNIVINWLLNNQLVQNTSRRYQNDSYLVIRNVNRDLDRGVFVCIAINIETNFSMESSTAKLNIYWIDDISVTVDDDSNENEILLNCFFSSSHNPTSIEWYKNGELVFDIFGNHEVNGTSLKISESNEDNNGIYSCSAIIEYDKRNLLSMDSLNGYVYRNKPNGYLPYLNKITGNGQMIRVKEDHMNLVLECNFSNAKSVTWKFRQDELKPSKNVKIFSNGTIVLTRIKGNDCEGFYVCSAVSQDESPVEYAIHLKVYGVEKPLFYPKGINNSTRLSYIVQKDKKFNVICVQPVSGLPLTVKWLKTWSNQTNEISDRDGNLVFSQLKYAHTGTYSCRIANKLNSVRLTNISLYVIDKPIIIESPKSQVLNNNLTNVAASFECKYEIPTQTNYMNQLANEFNGLVKVNWYFASNDGEPERIVFTDKQPINKQTRVSKYVISNISEKNIGNYACKIEIDNFDIVSSQYAQLNLKFKPTFKDVNLEHNIRIIDDDELVSVLLDCFIDNNNEQKITIDIKWTLLSNNKTVEQSISGSGVKIKQKNIKLLSNNSLLIENVSKNNSGVYKCHAITKFGNSSLKHVVNVYDFNSPAPIMNANSNGKSQKDTSINMKSTIVIVSTCIIIYVIIVVGLVIYCRNRINKKDVANNKNNNKKTLKPFIKIDSSNENNETAGMLTTYSRQNSNVNSKPSYLQTQQSVHQYDLIDVENDFENNFYGQQTNPFMYATNNSTVTHNTFKTQPPHNNTLTTNSSNRKHIPKPSRLHSCQLSASSSLTTLTSAVKYENNSFKSKEEYLQSLSNFRFYGRCCYGDVYVAKSELLNIVDQETRRNVALKIFRNVKHEQSIIEFHRDIETYSKLDHENIVRIIDICTDREGQAPNIIIFQHTELGDLKELLLKNSEHFKNPFQKLEICYQIALAMQHFEQKLLIHGDLAARNCIVYLRRNPRNNQLYVHIKVTNLALSGDKYINEYTYLNQVLNQPSTDNDLPIAIRWQAPEVVLENRQSIKSDVFSYGVCCWEIWKDGQLPYDGLSDLEVYQALKNFDLYRLENVSYHHNCPSELWTLMERCWLESIEMRPSFNECALVLRSIFDDIS